MAKKSNKELEEIKKNLDHTMQVPLLVKKSKVNKKRLSFKNKEKKINDEKVDDNKLSNALLICIIVFLLLITSYVIVSRIVESNTSSIMISKSSKKKTNEKISIFKEWVSLDNDCFKFTEDNTFYWYDDSTNSKDNYYSGNYSYKVGSEALKEIGYEEDDFQKIFGEKIALEKVFSLVLEPKEAFMEGKDQTDTFIPEGTTWWMIMVIKSDGSAILYNKTIDTKYHLRVKV